MSGTDTHSTQRSARKHRPDTRSRRSSGRSKTAPEFEEHQFEAHLKIKLRTAVETDLPALEWWGWYGEHREIIRSVFAEALRGQSLMLVADSGDFPVGQLWIDLARKKVAHVAILWALRVIPGFRGSGIGSRLIQAAENTLRKHGYRTCEIGVEDENVDARRLYERMGYQVIGKRRERRKYRDPAGVRKLIITDQWLLHKALFPNVRTTAA